MAGAGSVVTGSATQGTPWRHPPALPGAARRDRGCAVSAESQAAETTSALLQSGAIMLGTALIFVTLFRKLKLGATLGYIVGGALIGPHLLGLVQDPEDLAS